MLLTLFYIFHSRPASTYWAIVQKQCCFFYAQWLIKWKIIDGRKICWQKVILSHFLLFYIHLAKWRSNKQHMCAHDRAHTAINELAQLERNSFINRKTYTAAAVLFGKNIFDAVEKSHCHRYVHEFRYICEFVVLRSASVRSCFRQHS